MRRTSVLVGTIAVATSLAVPAAAKEGVRAKLDKPVRLDAAPGKTLHIAWHLIDAKGRPFGASGIYLRVSRCGRRPLRIPATARGHGGFSARVKVPKGGIRKLLVGLKGYRITGARTVRADVFFQFDPPVYRDCT
jgi:hypothetical protein